MRQPPSSKHALNGSFQDRLVGSDARQFYLGLWKLVLDGPWGGDSDPGQAPAPPTGGNGSTVAASRSRVSPRPAPAPRRRRPLVHA